MARSDRRRAAAMIARGLHPAAKQSRSEAASHLARFDAERRSSRGSNIR